MTDDELDFLDIELEVILRLRDTLAAGWGELWVGNTTPGDLEGRDAVRVTVTGGTDDEVTDWANVDLECFTPDRGRTRDLAEACRKAMRAMAATDPSGNNRLLDTVDTVQRPVWRDYGNSRVQRYTAVYAVASRRQ